MRFGKRHYRPHLDGLRTVAVVLVIAFHAGLGRFRGGFVGVDVFFVLSGFLVTGILMRDLASGGRVHWKTFYARRVRRILPAAVVALAGTAIVYAAVASPVETADALGGFRSAFFYVANWFFVRQATDYFAANVNTNPVVHFWSLAVEEQFYLLWPMLLTALYVIAGRAGRRRWWAIRGVVIAACVASAIEAMHIGSTNIDRAYYGTDTRAYQLLAGAALALTPQLLRLNPTARRVARAATPATLGGLLLLGSSAIGVSPITRGVLVAGLAVLLLISLEQARGGLTKRFLSSDPMTYLGRISYGIYLWHWPVIVVAGHGRHLTPIELFLLAIPISIALAALSFHLVEHPIRVSHALDGYRVQVVAIGLVTSVAAGAFAMPIILERDSTSPRSVDWRTAVKDLPPRPDCLGKPVSKCTLVHGTKARMLLLGDSHALMFVPTFVSIAEKESLTLSVGSEPACPWQRGLVIANFLIVDCARRQADWYGRLISQLDPDIVVLIDKGYDNPNFSLFLRYGNHKAIHVGKPSYERTLIDASSTSLAQLRRPGRTIVLVEPVPLSYPLDQLNCLSTGKAPAACAFRATRGPTRLERYYRMAANSSNIVSLDLDRLVCPRLPTCDAVVRNVIVRRDQGSHLTATFARSIASEVDAILRSKGILPKGKPGGR